MKFDMEYKKILDFSPDGIIVADKQTKEFIYVNPTICEMLGYTEQELKKLSFYGLHPKEDIPAIEEEFLKIDRRNGPVSLLIPCISKSGEIRSYEISSVAVDMDGRSCLLGVFRDIFRRQKLKKKAEQSSLKYVPGFQQATVGLARVGLEGNILEANNKLCEITGYTGEELKNKKIMDMIFADDPDVYAQDKKGKIKNFSAEKKYSRKDGDLIWIKFTMSLIYDKDKKPWYFIAAIEDTTQTKFVIDKLIESEEKFRSVFNQAAIGISRCNLDGTFIEVNDKLCEITGYAPEELIKKNFRELTYPEDIAPDLTYMNKLLKGEIIS